MSFELSFRLASYGLVAAGFLALGLSGEVAAWVVAAGFLWLPVAWRATSRTTATAARLAGVPPRAWSALTGLFALLALANVLLRGELIIVAIVELLVAIQLVKLLSIRTDRDYFQIYAISFFQLLAAATLSESLGFAVSFLLYMILATWTFLAFHLRQELAVQSPGETLAARRLLSLPFVATTTLLALGTLVFTAAIFLVVPRVGRGFLQRVGKPVKLTGFSDVVRLGEVGEIKNDPTVVMRIYAPAPDELPEPIGFWRGSAFDRYDGVAWSRSVVDRRQVSGEPGGRIVLGPPGSAAAAIRQTVVLEPIDTNVLFAAGRAVAMELLLGGPGRWVPFVYRDGMASVTAPGIPWTRIEYAVESDLSRPSPDALRAAPPAEPVTMQRFLHVPPLDPRVPELARQVTAGAATPYDEALALEAHLRTAYAYSLAVRPTPGVPPLEDFLFNTQTGYCEYSATAMAVMLRTLGIPSRMVSGFLRGDWNEYGGYYLVRQSEAHTWVEAYFPGAGWVAFDPTPPAGTTAGRPGVLSALGRWLDAVRSRWNRYVVGYSLADQVAAARAVRGGTADLAARVRDLVAGAAGRARALVTKLREVEVPGWAAWPSLALLAVILLRGRALMRRTTLGAYLERRRLNNETLRIYARAVAAAGARGVPRGAAQTAREHAARARAAGLSEADALLEVARLYEAVRFGAHRATPGDVRAARAALARLHPRRPGRMDADRRPR